MSTLKLSHGPVDGGWLLVMGEPLSQGGIEECAPFGLSTFQTSAQIKDIRWRGL